MKEIDTESSAVIWPDWCYTGNILKQSASDASTKSTVDVKTLQQRPIGRRTALSTATAAAATFGNHNNNSNNESHTFNGSQEPNGSVDSDCSSNESKTNNCNSNHSDIGDIVTHKSPNKRKRGCYSNNHRTTKTLRQSSLVNGVGVGGDAVARTTIAAATTRSSRLADALAVKPDDIDGSNRQQQQQQQALSSKSPLPVSSASAVAAAAAAAVAAEMLSERSLLLSGGGGYSPIDSSSVKQFCPGIAAGNDLGATPPSTAAAAAAFLYLEKVKNEKLSPRVTAAQIDCLKDAIMESAAASGNTNNNNNNNNSSSSNYNNTTISNSGGNSNHNQIQNTNNNNNHSSNNKANTNNSNSSNSSNSTNNNTIQNTNNIISNNLAAAAAAAAAVSGSIISNSHHQHHHQQQHQQSLPHHQLHHHNQLAQNQQQQGIVSTNTNNVVKRERLSPGTNGELQSSLSRSRSATPSSFRGTPPQQPQHVGSTTESVLPLHALPSTLLSIQQAASADRQAAVSAISAAVAAASAGTANVAGGGSATLPSDFSTRNYSDFMRSLAAKYNNSNPNDDTSTRRSAFFDSLSSSPLSGKLSKVNPSGSGKQLSNNNSSSSSALASTLAKKDVTAAPLPLPVHAPAPPLPPPQPALSPSDVSVAAAAAALQQQTQNAQNQMAAAAAAASVSPFMTSLLTSLPFSQSVFPPLIDMASTQALLTLARAVKEAEIQNILRPPQSPSNRSNSCTSASILQHHTLSVALQQAAQFVSPALLYSTQMQQQQQQQRQQQQAQTSRQSSPLPIRTQNAAPSNSGGVETHATAAAAAKRNSNATNSTAPLDLSSQPPAAKRSKLESCSSSAGSDIGAVETLHIAATRRTSSSTATPSPPLSEKNTDASSSAALRIAQSASPAVLPHPSTKRTSTTPNAIRQCQAQSDEVNSWTVNDVCAFVGDIDICADYVQSFRDQCIDGSGLPLLTEDHLVNSLGMKLGPALKLRSVLAKKLGGPCPCVACVAQAQQMLALQASTSSNNNNVSSNINNLAAAEGMAAATGAGSESHHQKQQQQQQQLTQTPRRISNSSSGNGIGNNFNFAANVSAVPEIDAKQEGNCNNKNDFCSSSSSSNHNNNHNNNDIKPNNANFVNNSILNSDIGRSSGGSVKNVSKNNDNNSNSNNNNSSKTLVQHAGSNETPDIGS